MILSQINTNQPLPRKPSLSYRKRENSNIEKIHLPFGIRISYFLFCPLNIFCLYGIDSGATGSRFFEKSIVYDSLISLCLEYENIHRFFKNVRRRDGSPNDNNQQDYLFAY